MHSSPPKTAVSAQPSAAQKTPEKTSPTKAMVPAGQRRQLKLVMDQLAPVNIRPKVGVPHEETVHLNVPRVVSGWDPRVVGGWDPRVVGRWDPRVVGGWDPRVVGGTNL